MKLGSIRQLSGWLWRTGRGYRLQALLNTLVGLLAVVADLAFVWTTKLAVDIATHTRQDVELASAVLLLVGIVVLQIALGISMRWIKAALGVKAQNRMQQQIFARLLGGEWKALRKFHTGDLLNRIERDVRDVITFLTESIPSLVSTCMQFAGAFIFLFLMDRTLACIIVLVIPFFILCSKLYIRKMRFLTHDIRESESRIQAVIQESLQHSLVVKTLGRTTLVRERLEGLQRRLRTQVLTRTKYATVSSTLMNAGFAAGYLLTFVWGVHSLEKGAITYGALIAFIQLVGQIQGPVRTLTKFIPVFIGTFTAAERLIALEEIPEETCDAPAEMPVGGLSGIRIEHLDFAYAPSGRSIFRHFDFDFPPGSITAIVGETGAGKTTLVRLMLALIAPVQGRVCLYGADGKNVSASASTRSSFSYVPQGNTLLSGTIRDNLLLGNPDATDEELVSALKAAAADFVLALPKGMNSICGEMGDGLSEGQAQRIAIARALLKKSPILLLDEATSALDAETERLVLHNIIQSGKDRTVICITHRPEVLRYCTQTLQLNRQ